MNHEDSEVGDPVQEAWQAAMSHIDLHYSVKDRAIIMSATTAEEVIAHIEALHVRSKAYPKIQLLEKAKPFIENLQEYSKILGAFSNANMAVSLIWGSTKLVLVILYRFIDYLDRIMEFLYIIGENLPRIKQAVTLYCDKNKLRHLLASVFGCVIEFCTLITKTFSRRGFQIWGGLLWGKFHGESTRIIADMNRHREQIDLEMNANNIIEAKTARREERANRELFAYLEVIKWLNPSEIEHQLDDLLRDKEEGTCMWFFQDPTVNSWIKGVVSLLWINGIPGCGKSVLCSSLISSMKQTTSTVPMAYFFCDGSDHTKRRALSVLCTLISQLIASEPRLVNTALNEMMRSGQKKVTSLSCALRLFKAVVAQVSCRTYLIIDAWDECEDGDRAKLLNDLAAISLNSKISLAVFSRPEPWLRKNLETWPTIEVSSTSIQEDILLYVQRSTAKLPVSKLNTPQLTQRILDTLVSKADGQFLWARLMINTLEKATFQSDIAAILDNVPKGLGGLYNRVLEKLLNEPERRQDAARILLRWLSCSERHLSISELSTALAICPGAPDIDSCDLVLDIEGFLQDVCGALVKISSPRGGRNEPVISFVHTTVKEYLLSSDELFGPQRLSISKFAVRSVETNHYLATICITYLSLDVFRSKEDEPEDSRLAPQELKPPFLDYAILYWARHLSQSGHPSMEMLRLLNKFLQSKKLLDYLDKVATMHNNTYTSMASILVTENYLSDWVNQCNAQDQRLSSVISCFTRRLEEAIVEQRKQYGEDDKVTLATQFQLAQLRHRRGDWVEAQDLLRTVYNGYRSCLGEDDETTLKSMHHLSVVLRRLGNHDESEKLQSLCLEMRRNTLGYIHQDTLDSEDELATILKERLDLHKALDLSRMTLMKRKRTCGHESLHTIASMYNLTTILKDVGRKELEDGSLLLAKQAFWECESLSLACLAMRERELGHDNPEVINCVNILGIVVRHLGRPEESEQYHRRALGTRLKIFGQLSPHTQRSMRNLIGALRDQGKVEEAESMDIRLQESQRLNSCLKDRDLAVGYDQLHGPCKVFLSERQ